MEGDRYAAGIGTWSDYPVRTGLALTLIEAEVLEAVGLTGAAARRNLVTLDVRLNDLVGNRFRIGEVECHGDRLCEPCSHLERLTRLSPRALAHRGGLRADVISGGEIAVGDAVVFGLSRGSLRAELGWRRILHVRAMVRGSRCESGAVAPL